MKLLSHAAGTSSLLISRHLTCTCSAVYNVSGFPSFAGTAQSEGQSSHNCGNVAVLKADFFTICECYLILTEASQGEKKLTASFIFCNAMYCDYGGGCMRTLLKMKCLSNSILHRNTLMGFADTGNTVQSIRTFQTFSRTSC